jgi:hypothetical protein
MKNRVIPGALLFVLLLTGAVGAEPAVFSGQASVWQSAGDQSYAGCLYLPELRIFNPFNMGKRLDLDLSLKLLGSTQNNASIRPYRGWARYATSQFEFRAGLQKINFGPAKLLRSLMWFDRLDPRDPLQMTDGVYAVLCRYNFLNNANIWAWSLWGNNSLKGLERFASDPNAGELGGRWQFPVTRGEVAVSFNRRYVDRSDWNNRMPIVMTCGLENRLALDGSWDLGVGFWFEASTATTQVDAGNAFFEKMLTVGTDYTFSLGPGLHVLAEHYLRSSGPSCDQQSNQNQLTAASLDFQLNMLDRIYAIAYYDWQAQKTYPYLRWQRSYDNWQINLMGYANSRNEPGAFTGNGVSCMIVYNH